MDSDSPAASDAVIWHLTPVSRGHLPDLSQALTAQILTHMLTLTALCLVYRLQVALERASPSPSCWGRAVRWICGVCPCPGDDRSSQPGTVLVWRQRAILPFFSDLSPPLLVSTCVSTGIHGSAHNSVL